MSLRTTKRVLLPLEPDFSNMSDPSIVIELPSISWRLDNRMTSQTRCSSRRDQTKRKHKSRKRRRHRLSSSSSSRSFSSDSHKCCRRSKGLNSLIRGEDDQHLLLPLIMITADIKEVDKLCRLQRYHLRCNLQRQPV